VLEQALPNDGIAVVELNVKVLLYADGFVLLADDPAGLQRMLDCLHGFCVSNGLTVNTGKSEVVVYEHRRNQGRDRRQGLPNSRYAQQLLQVKPEFAYLGLLYRWNDGVLKANSKCLVKATGAMMHDIDAKMS